MSQARVAVLGPSGRMGQIVCDRVIAAADLELASLIDRPDAGMSEYRGIAVTSDLSAGFEGADVYIDFTTPASTIAAAEVAARRGLAAVIGTTGLPDAARARLEALAKKSPVLVASNFSLGVHLLAALAETAARALGPAYDAELVELHHKRKRDAPSGTALTLAEAVARGRGQALSEVACFARHGDVGARPDGEIGLSAVRGGDIIGEHTVYLIGESERIELTHRAGDRALFADGALATARWLVGREPGLYQMRDVLGLGG